MIEADLLLSRQYFVILVPNIIVHDVSTCASLQFLGFLNYNPQPLEMHFAF